MAVQDSEFYQIWSTRITLSTTLIVVVLSWLNAMTILDIILRGMVSFGVMYFLMAGIHSLFKNTATQKPKNILKSSTKESSLRLVVEESLTFLLETRRLNPRLKKQVFLDKLTRI